MKAWASLETLEAAAAEVGVKLDHPHRDGRAWRFRILPDDRRDAQGNHKYQRTSASGFHPSRRVHAVCWHGHRDFMLAVFDREPDARIKTMWADYRGEADFMQKYPDTAHRNVGSMMYPYAASDVCTCGHDEWLVDISTGPGMSTYMIRQSVFRRCPFLIMVPSHYRDDGTCKCDDPAERERMMREWDYTPADFERVGVTA